MAIEKIAVIGCGQMGLGIAESAATHGVHVVAVKLTPGDLEAPRRTVLKGLERRVARGKLTAEQRDGIMSRLHFTSDLNELAGVGLVIESCLEELQTKGEILAKLEGFVPATTVLASNTSSLRLSELAGFLKHPERFLALHFFNPVPAMKLVEVSATVQTSSAARQLATDFCSQIDKTAVQIRDTPGYVVNRLLVPYILHAIETLEQGVASADAIDVAMKLGCGHPMGPLALADLIGLDVVFAMAKTMHHELRDSRYRAPSLLRRLVLAGHLGRKSTRGIYDYTDAANPCVNPAISNDAPAATGT
ncbi:MAG: 3-hydroxybutyryl-CoA dehydrogenase [Myxococcaceae bacterium]|nr:3-hydroxybutyryl-CoA dehydrogenase [Myxococcaceae bacterium]